MRVRGLKSADNTAVLTYSTVAPHAGAWIEIGLSHQLREAVSVAPHAGAWIEIVTLQLRDHPV